MGFVPDLFLQLSFKHLNGPVEGFCPSKRRFFFDTVYYVYTSLKSIVTSPESNANLPYLDATHKMYLKSDMLIKQCIGELVL